ncbi:tRNA (adenosine(37)-N6)-threonylcarbamoyltransferase complex ATPase subunit type 1 TsaE [Candidatus Azambacteria bacterium RIFCSPHIGHO2_01_FULL_44_55]|uniref:tRNA threonylcarbamoyladenosine biosynthesis protein TsaE n=1 Tax=Candidatus Azambacteria bacterium RIFCSPLOWO2_02_FULL_44_14 TaxID=1797306 RepID=A0A1F5CB38_9BACT|nr:MAG: tRNA (adenosine(37)-N6)-threonylcarbamoyltransferase complex ATPase subunit type 1 TsaE [Candidatus Azambacteria bacterium RIFCSPHIGHO2_02_FULL_45_18]OGD40081.1 MAG: tRNA (adenosine(37)-N6)-threonylcarbamoyltransferase complex ATPase subunit type 1 TsaE [Candidatus Azambacteria bacterium RIFCSPLOWO2_02_FULL_44_14]OGD40927.1 MAG: tRNA (adenosine(37)-N6)-threonylcarbamoyltransferase complex ATPase subunit type 1 TsaE [Candidatus Azambacteria bacterium RIFCSPHIGHO2_01_FULL_44_55]OGD50498.1 
MFERLEIVTKTADETKKTAAALGIELKRERRQINALIIALEGHLGSGKTTFIQGLAEGMGVKENVLSPTFLILKQFFLKSGRYKNLYHIDAYRLKNPGEMIELGFKDLINDPENIIVIEWADKIRKILLKDTIWIKFYNLGGDKRKILINLKLKIQNSKP